MTTRFRVVDFSLIAHSSFDMEMLVLQVLRGLESNEHALMSYGYVTLVLVLCGIDCITGA